MKVHYNIIGDRNHVSIIACNAIIKDTLHKTYRGDIKIYIDLSLYEVDDKYYILLGSVDDPRLVSISEGDTILGALENAVNQFVNIYEKAIEQSPNPKSNNIRQIAQPMIA